MAYFKQRLNFGANVLESQTACAHTDIHASTIEYLRNNPEYREKGVHYSVNEVIKACQSGYAFEDSGYSHPYSYQENGGAHLKPVLDSYLGLFRLEDPSGPNDDRCLSFENNLVR